MLAQSHAVVFLSSKGVYGEGDLDCPSYQGCSQENGEFYAYHLKAQAQKIHNRARPTRAYISYIICELAIRNIKQQFSNALPVTISDNKARVQYLVDGKVQKRARSRHHDIS
ncbi:predicted protein [Histoplasma capsulatum H143]|uniref:Uncharacterized protein n=1 Tax=Ajellomyces capsulatus (strain H143) TaxID=544712 RepID=C6H5X6_AJECH|nr:predicted protein [Histoplasma capsulatum H143]